ncbi:hypothetical protein EON65_55965, partial [archaeon]
MIVEDTGEAIGGESDDKPSLVSTTPSPLIPTDSLAPAHSTLSDDKQRNVIFTSYCEYFVDRLVEQEAILAGLRERDLMEIWGGVGVGKHTLACQIAHKISIDATIVYSNSLG